jgi:hypothetical protein
MSTERRTPQVGEYRFTLIYGSYNWEGSCTLSAPQLQRAVRDAMMQFLEKMTGPDGTTRWNEPDVFSKVYIVSAQDPGAGVAVNWGFIQGSRRRDPPPYLYNRAVTHLSIYNFCICRYDGEKYKVKIPKLFSEPSPHPGKALPYGSYFGPSAVNLFAPENPALPEVCYKGYSRRRVSNRLSRLSPLLSLLLPIRS